MNLMKLIYMLDPPPPPQSWFFSSYSRAGQDIMWILNLVIFSVKSTVVSTSLTPLFRRGPELNSEPEFEKLLRSPGIDSQPGGPARLPCLMYRPARLHRMAESIPWNQFLDSLNVYKFGLRMLTNVLISFFSYTRMLKMQCDVPSSTCIFFGAEGVS